MVKDDALNVTMAPLGITARTNAVAFNATPPEAEGRVNDQVDEWRRQQPVWVLNELGSHPITAGLEKLPLMMIPVIPTFTSGAKGVTTTHLLPLTDGPLQNWGKQPPTPPNSKRHV